MNNEEPNIHLPSPSFWPIVLSGGLALIAVGVVSTILISVVGVVVALTAIAGWALENRATLHEEHDDEHE